MTARRIGLTILLPFLLSWQLSCSDAATSRAGEDGQERLTGQKADSPSEEWQVICDFDYDGIPNRQEILDGTNPVDPGNARAWHPEIDDYPRLLGDAADWLAVKAAIQAGEPDAVRLFGRLESMAARAEIIREPGTHSFPDDQTNSYTAMAAAFAAFVLDDPTLAAKAAQIAAHLYFDYSLWSLDEWDYGTILGGMTLANHCLSYDLLVGFGLVDAELAAAARAAVFQYAETLYHEYVTVPIGKALMNNHLIKFTSGLGLVGMTFNDVPEAPVLVNLALSTAPWVLFDFQMPEGGGQGEGPNYLDYTMGTFLPFVAAYHRYARGVTLPYKVVCRVRLEFPCEPRLEWVADPLADPRLTGLLDWRMALTMPSGPAAPLDDSNLSCAASGPLAALCERGDYAWQYRNSRDCRENTSGLALLELAFLDQMPAPQLPEYDSIMLPEAGQAVLRTGWEADDLFTVLNGEHGTARLAGLGHEQADAASFMIHAFGEYLLIDSGYIGYDERRHVCRAENHNLILVDDEGPSIGLFYLLADADAWLSDFIDRPLFQAARVQSVYRETEVERRLAMIGDAVFVTHDLVAGDRPHRYTWLLHTNAGGSTDGEFHLTYGGAWIARPQAAMRLVLQSDAPLVFAQGEDEHGFGHGAIETHAVLRAETTATTARTLGLYLPAADVTALPTVRDVSAGDLLVYLVEGEEVFDLVVAGDGNDYLFDVPDVPVVLQSDAGLAWVRYDPLTGAVLTADFCDGTYLEYE